MLHAKTLVTNAPSADITVEGNKITMILGYPAAKAADADADGGIALAAGIEATDYTINTDTDTECTISNGAWKVVYTEATAATGVASVGLVEANN
jgi:hypothetical protein